MQHLMHRRTCIDVSQSARHHLPAAWRKVIQSHQSGPTTQKQAYHLATSTNSRPTSLITIDKASFYRHHPSATTRAIKAPILCSDLSFVLPADIDRHGQRWAVVSSSAAARTAFLKLLQGRYICDPPHARRYPGLGTDVARAIQYIGFDAERQGGASAGASITASHLSARYESHREPTDFTLGNYLTGQTELNAIDKSASLDHQLLHRVTTQLNLGALLHNPVSSLSNGQTRRAKIARALMLKPKLLLLDGPFMGLDPRSARSISNVLQSLAEQNSPSQFLSLRADDQIPHWITHLVSVTPDMKVDQIGQKADFLSTSHFQPTHQDVSPATALSRDGFSPRAFKPTSTRHVEPLVEMQSVKLSYGTTPILGHWIATPSTSPGLTWTISRGERWSIFGPNGSGKTTLLSLITSDHPQTYSLPIKLFGRSRLPAPGEKGISVFELQRRIGHSSPEVHAYFPKSLTLRRTLESAFADAPLSRPVLDDKAKRRVDACLVWFAAELKPTYARQREVISTEEDLDWATKITFYELSFSNQRLALFLRAIVSSPDLVLLDEALGGMDASLRDKALLFLSWGQRKNHGLNRVVDSDIPADQVVMTGLSDEQALVTISHTADDVPGCINQWICLPEVETGRPPQWGRFPGPLELHPECWDEVWRDDTVE